MCIILLLYHASLHVHTPITPLCPHPHTPHSPPYTHATLTHHIHIHTLTHTHTALPAGLEVEDPSGEILRYLSFASNSVSCSWDVKGTKHRLLLSFLLSLFIPLLSDSFRYLAFILFYFYYLLLYLLLFNDFVLFFLCGVRLTFTTILIFSYNYTLLCINSGAWSSFVSEPIMACDKNEGMITLRI
jgi:hypothetical protein